MSAIAGIVHLASGRQEELAGVGQSMMDALRRYDADERHAWCEAPVFLGCSNQWITPESREERIPYRDQARGLVITADAILDNRDELFDRLDIPRYDRPHTGDAELILLSYAKWGEACPAYLLGDFAFMLWDERNERLFGARDMCGNRTLYYYADDERFAFSTVISPLFHVPGAKKELEWQWIAEYLAITGLHECSDASLTPYRNIYHVLPAHSITIAKGKVRTAKYGSILPEQTLRLRSNGEYEEAFREVVGKAVTARLRTYRHAAATLSGGLDSGTVVSFASRALREQGKRLYTYSYVPLKGFKDWTPSRLTGDERRYIQSVEQYVGNIESHYLDFADKHPVSEIEEILDMIEGPYKYFGGIYWIKGIYEEASRHGAGVLLTGGRGNFTISWGPALDYYALLLKQFHWLRLYRELKHYSRRMNVGRSRLLGFIGSRAFPFLEKRTDEAMPMLIHPDLARQTGIWDRKLDEQFDLLSGNSFQDRKYKFDNLAISNKSGVASTKLSLRYGLWERDPTFDPRVVKFCLSVPIEQYVSNGMDRALVRRATAGYLPDDVRLNQTVRGVQAADWVYRLLPIWPKILAELGRLCDDAAMAGILNVDQIRKAVLDIGLSPRQEDAFQPKMQFLIRSLIVYRFLKIHLS